MRRFGLAQKAGDLAEAFCLRKFGIQEGDKYEIKSSSWQNAQVIIKSIQLLQSLEKHYVICRYRREAHKIKRGKRKGSLKYDESIEAAIKKHVWVHVVKGIDLLQIISAERLPVFLTNYHNDERWAAYWVVKIRHFPEGEVSFEDDEVTVYGYPDLVKLWLEVPF